MATNKVSKAKSGWKPRVSKLGMSTQAARMAKLNTPSRVRKDAKLPLKKKGK